MSRHYLVTFKYENLSITKPYFKGIADLKEGFWVDKELNPDPPLGNSLFFIMSHHIEKIELVGEY